MRKQLAKTAETPSRETLHAYERQALRHIRRATRIYPTLPPFAALKEEVSGRMDLLRPRTVRLYRAEMGLALKLTGTAAGLFEREIEEAQDLCRTELDRLKGRPEPKRTASKKVKDATQKEVARVFAELKRTALKTGSMMAAAAALYCVVAPRMGPRPKELLDAEVRGNLLIFPNAKATVRHPDTRALDMSEFGPVFVEAVVTLLALVARQVAELGFERWRNAMAETLARACARASTRRLSLYGFRHVSIATWEAAGLTKEEIAAMAGHLGLETARIHYARARHGWKVKVVARAVGQADVYAGAIKDDETPARTASTKTMSTRKIAADREKKSPSRSGNATAEELWATHRAKLNATLDALDAQRSGSSKRPAANKYLPSIASDHQDPDAPDPQEDQIRPHLPDDDADSDLDI
ncbi:hypothetical protein [Devosia sp. MC1541]|uniref:hypothetical protein n=1 Tax=Devosia sp. MC1541 TaxID=2725264 RepID=UPI00145EB34B|nr:hypothetical protein [Devosia sp. MC1541]